MYLWDNRYTAASGARGSKSRHEPFAHVPSAHVARAVAPQDLDRALFGVRAVDVHRDHAPAARLDRMLERGRAALAGRTRVIEPANDPT